ncbi:GGDEF domain-containing protein [Quadrisphaera setariae]|uniref:GGDEF domain-containing protein n=1 Tax=Quadrisphaera setariae TaxID=2593304 RepID=A0A5C8ZFY5_9ACTN|nr:GGDEF domain-containing protein [Quadrisphaera setariae]TXR56772.1 GGDEF domain-containing protein [Quadrisphaera setariae]
MPDRAADGRLRARVLACLVLAAVAVGVVASFDPTTLRPGAWTVAFTAALVTGAAVGAALLASGQRWSGAALTAVVCGLQGVVVLSVLANQTRSGGMLNVVLLLPLAVYAAVHLSPRQCRTVMAVLVVGAAVVMEAVADGVLQWVSLTAVPVLAFLGTAEVVLRLRSELGGALGALREQAATDPLTGLLNRRGLHERLPGAADAPTGFRCVMVLDLDHFKAVNDTFGHEVGDEVLRRFAAGLAGETRATDLAVRLGGEEFLVLTDVPADRAHECAEGLRSRAAQWLAEWSVTVSVGVVVVPGAEPRGASRAELLAAVRAADDCLYRAKELGRDRTVVQVAPAAPATAANAG